jgi:hypothetical protein
MSPVRHRAALALALACCALAACARQPPSVAALLSQHDEAKALERIRSSAGPPADDPGWALAMNSAAFQGSVPVLRELLARGADSNAQRNGGTPLTFATSQSTARVNEDAIRFLLDAKADPRIPNINGSSPLELLERGAEPRVLADTPGRPKEAHGRAKTSGEEFALYGDWLLGRNDVAGARAAYQTAKEQLTQATADVAAVDRDACSTALHEVEAKLAALPASTP